MHKHQPLFRYAYFIGLSPESHFRLHPFTEEEVGFDGIAIVFHQFTSSRFSDKPSEELAGWVPPSMAERAEAWVANRERIRHWKHEPLGFRRGGMPLARNEGPWPRRGDPR